MNNPRSFHVYWSTSTKAIITPDCATMRDAEHGNWRRTKVIKITKREQAQAQLYSTPELARLSCGIRLYSKSRIQPHSFNLTNTQSSCAAEKFNLPALQRLALRKQGLHSGITVNTILASARYAYAHTPDTESKLRAHYLALIIRCRGTFKRSGTMQMEMEKGGKLFFDLFVAMCNHMVCSLSLCCRPWSGDWIG